MKTKSPNVKTKSIFYEYSRSWAAISSSRRRTAPGCLLDVVQFSTFGHIRGKYAKYMYNAPNKSKRHGQRYEVKLNCAAKKGKKLIKYLRRQQPNRATTSNHQQPTSSSEIIKKSRHSPQITTIHACVLYAHTWLLSGKNTFQKQFYICQIFSIMTTTSRLLVMVFPNLELPLAFGPSCQSCQTDVPSRFQSSFPQCNFLAFGKSADSRAWWAYLLASSMNTRHYIVHRGSS